MAIAAEVGGGGKEAACVGGAKSGLASLLVALKGGMDAVLVGGAGDGKFTKKGLDKGCNIFWRG